MKIIDGITEGSIAHELGIEPQDKLIDIDGERIIDVFDYRMAAARGQLVLNIEKADGELWELMIEKDEDEDLGLIFNNGLMDNPKSCNNNCIFCFIHQNPRGMRGSVYFKDDDYRLSYLHGNYITLTNTTQADIDRIIKYRISPVNISIHATDHELRCKMMGHKGAGAALAYLEQLAAGGIELNMQIVLCKGYNDREQLDKTIYDLSRYIPKGLYAQGFSLSVVPVGITRHRESNGLTKLAPLNKYDCLDTLMRVERWQDKLLSEFGTRFVHAADEFYVKARIPLPPISRYEGFSQMDNGIGLLSLMQHEMDEFFEGDMQRPKAKHYSIATGTAAAPTISAICQRLAKAYNIKIDVHSIDNAFFGSDVTVSGLMVGRDIIDRLRGQSLGELLLLPASALRHGERVFLDDTSLDDISAALGVPVTAPSADAAGLIEGIFH